MELGAIQTVQMNTINSQGTCFNTSTSLKNKLSINVKDFYEITVQTVLVTTFCTRIVKYYRLYKTLV